MSLVMLQSELFRGDRFLEAAAVNDAAHITPGSRGTHVSKIQTALNVLISARLATDGVFGQRTADAVLSYKRARSIINRAYQSQPDNIVGRMTIAALDRELLKFVEPIVIIGRPSIVRAAKPPVLAVGGPSASPAVGRAVTSGVSAVIRGNPFVGKNAVDVGLPPSIPPGRSYTVDVTVTPPLSGDQQIDLEVTGVDGVNGGALVRPPQIQSSQSVIVLGFRQTEPGHAGNLRIQASLGGKVLAVSNAFSVCAHPSAVICEKKEDLDDGNHLGVMVRVSLESDSGSTSHLDKAMWNELVDEVQRDSPPFSATGNSIVQPNFLPCVWPLCLFQTCMGINRRAAARANSLTNKFISTSVCDVVRPTSRFRIPASKLPVRFAVRAEACCSRRRRSQRQPGSMFARPAA